MKFHRILRYGNYLKIPIKRTKKYENQIWMIFDFDFLVSYFATITIKLNNEELRKKEAF